jgi:SAM-dependent methyltransferase
MIHDAASLQPATQSPYLLPNSQPETLARFTALSEMFDGGTIHHLDKCGVTRGWHCLEVGAGGGSIASWLADRVGPTGYVLATDIDPRFLETAKRPNVEVRRHNITADALPEAAFDLVHSRLVLLHLRARERALTRMISALKPAGWLVIEEYDSASMPPDPKVSPGEILLHAHLAMMRLFEDGGVNRRYGRLLFGRLRAHGLNDVGAEGRVFMLQCGSSGASMLRANYEQLRPALIDSDYITATQFDEDLAYLDDPDFMMPSGILWSAWGRRP